MNVDKPWEELEKRIDSGSSDSIKTFISALKADDVVVTMNHLTKEDQLKLISYLTPAEAAEVIDDIPSSQALKILEELTSSDAAAIITEMPSDEKVDYLAEMSEQDADAIIENLNKDEAEQVRELIQYDSESAGGLMIKEFLAFDLSQTIGDVVRSMKENAAGYEKLNLRYLYVTDKGQFYGVLQVRDLILHDHSTSLDQIVVKEAKTLHVNDNFDDLIKTFDNYDFYGIPVVGDRGELLGAVLRKDVRAIEANREQVQLLETQGIVGGEELRTLPILTRSKRRLSWLSVNILLNIMAASIIAFYQDTLSSVIALAVFLPIISDMSGCSGNQAVAVSLRELSLGVVRPFEIVRVWFQELSVGLINGLVLGILIGVAAWLWQGNVYLGLVVGGALAVNTLVAVSLGGSLPLILKKWNVDPALASGPILTTVTDMCGFFMALSFAGIALEYL